MTRQARPDGVEELITTQEGTTMARSKKAASTQRARVQDRVTAQDEIKVSVLIPKHADANPNNPDDWRELGPGEPLPEPYHRRITEAFAPMLLDFLCKVHLGPDD